MSQPESDQPVIMIFGSYSPQAGEQAYQQAYDIGFALARAGCVVANGGYDGIMHASAKGAKDAGGTTLGITCAIFSDYRGIPLHANEFIDREILHDNVLSRIDQMVRMAAGYVVLPGGTGTLAELGVAWEYVAKGLIPPRPLMLVGNFWRPMAERLIAERPKSGRYLHFVESPDQIVSIARNHHPENPNPA